jgi:hypothetical protein
MKPKTLNKKAKWLLKNGNLNESERHFILDFIATQPDNIRENTKDIVRKLVKRQAAMRGFENEN